jgi:hypothetical protein
MNAVPGCRYWMPSLLLASWASSHPAYWALVAVLTSVIE